MLPVLLAEKLLNNGFETKEGYGKKTQLFEIKDWIYDKKIRIIFNKGFVWCNYIQIINNQLAMNNNSGLIGSIDISDLSDVNIIDHDTEVFIELIY